jgi:radical SAM enzyme (TIGR01210 family)
MSPEDQWVLTRRGSKVLLDPLRAYAATWEEEPDSTGRLAPTAVVFITNNECPFHCVMCDLWVHTLDTRVPIGAIPHQIREACATLPTARQIKLYNAGSFFDPDAIPPEDDEEIARTVERFERVIVESHPAFLTGAHGDRCLRFRDRLSGRLEVAVGLETADPAALARLNKRMTLDSFARAADFVVHHAIDLRAFILLKPPFAGEDDYVESACRSIDYARAHGASVCSVIPTRGGNGAMEALDPPFVPPTLRALEQVMEYGLTTAGLSRVFADLWDIARFFTCACSPTRVERLRKMNLAQQIAMPVACSDC